MLPKDHLFVKRRNARFFSRGELPLAVLLAVFAATPNYFLPLPIVVEIAVFTIAMSSWCFVWARADADSSYRLAPIRQALLYGVAIYMGTRLSGLTEGGLIFPVLLAYGTTFALIVGAAGHLSGRISHHLPGDSLPGYLSSVALGMATVWALTFAGADLEQWTKATMLIQLLMGGVLYAGYRWSVRRSLA